MIGEYDAYFLKLFTKLCYPLKVPSAPKILNFQQQKNSYLLKYYMFQVIIQIQKTFYFDFDVSQNELYANYVQNYVDFKSKKRTSS